MAKLLVVRRWSLGLRLAAVPPIPLEGQSIKLTPDRGCQRFELEVNVAIPPIVSFRSIIFPTPFVPDRILAR